MEKLIGIFIIFIILFLPAFIFIALPRPEKLIATGLYFVASLLFFHLGGKDNSIQWSLGLTFAVLLIAIAIDIVFSPSNGVCDFIDCF
jgi:hypothetical protein